MCGIIGVVAENASSIYSNNLITMRDSMRHRGPDDAGVWWSEDGKVGLAQRRLAIIDLSPSGHQPMTDATGQLWITFNGEIYNYQELRMELISLGHSFRSASDTEVILEAYRAWGTDCLQHFNGMFAFGLYDLARRQLFLARDRAGEKPLFYWYQSGKLVFASELKAIMADPTFPRQLDLEALDYYLAYGYVPREKCILKNAFKIAPGEAALYNVDFGELKRWQYWQPPAPSFHPAESAEELEHELETLLLDSVRQRLIADVPVGILLSGGVDSSLVVAMAAQASATPVHTFTISFPENEAFNEGPYARMVADHFGTVHTELEAEPFTVDLLPELARQFDEPMADSSMVPTYLVSRLVRQHATVALGGDGGDELFGGYPHYSMIEQQEKMRRLISPRVRKMVGLSASSWLPVGTRGRNHLIGFASDLTHSIAHINMYFDATTRKKLALKKNGSRGSAGIPEEYKVSLCNSDYSALQQATRADFLTTMVDAYLVKVDRASMLASLEMRAPWLDHRIIEMAFARVPDALKATTKERKILPRRLAARLLPSQLDLKRKQGFTMPLQAWFKGQWGTFIEEVITQAPKDFLDASVIQNLINGQRRGLNNTQRLFALTMLELWRREYRISI